MFKKVNLKEGKIYFESWFHKAQAVVVGAIISRPVVRSWTTMQRQKMCVSVQQKAEWEGVRREGPGTVHKGEPHHSLLARKSPLWFPPTSNNAFKLCSHQWVNTDKLRESPRSWSTHFQKPASWEPRLQGMGFGACSKSKLHISILES